MTGNDVKYTYGTSGNETGRFLLWTEDCYGCEHLLCLFNVVNNRMHAAVDEKYSSYYVHDHSGERRESRDQSQACLSYAETKQSVRSDHLGSASWITDNGGLAVQHLQYLPYGERYVDQRAVGYNERFTFTGKEKDSLRLNLQSGELCRARLTSPPDLFTSYYYFGARYMDHELMTMWLSVDPMADKYPSISPYAYCAWNPVKLVDPDGREVVVVGDKIDKILQKLSYQKLDISYNDKTGRLEAKLNNCTINDLSDDEKMLYSAIMDPNVCVQIASFTAAKDKNGNDCFIDPIDNVTAYGTEGGSFYEGILIKNNETGVSIARTLSFVDVDLMDKNGYDNGVPHEITEGYLVGRKMIERDVSYVGMATQNGNNPIVKEAHAEAVSEKKIKNSINY